MNSFLLLEEDLNVDDFVNNNNTTNKNSKKKNKQYLQNNLNINFNKDGIKKLTEWSMLYQYTDIWRNILEFQEIYSLFKYFCLINKSTNQFIQSPYFLQLLIIRNEKKYLQFDISIKEIAKKYDPSNILQLYYKKKKPLNSIGATKIFKNIYFELKKELEILESTNQAKDAAVRKFVFENSEVQKMANKVKSNVLNCSHNNFTEKKLTTNDILSENGKYCYQYICDHCKITLLCNFYPHERIDIDRRNYYYKKRFAGYNNLYFRMNVHLKVKNFDIGNGDNYKIYNYLN
ncbi:hypothetical protein ABK040_000383 [Willaertia magna]